MKAHRLVDRYILGGSCEITQFRSVMGSYTESTQLVHLAVRHGDGLPPTASPQESVQLACGREAHIDGNIIVVPADGVVMKVEEGTNGRIVVHAVTIWGDVEGELGDYYRGFIAESTEHKRHMAQLCGDFNKTLELVGITR